MISRAKGIENQVSDEEPEAPAEAPLSPDYVPRHEHPPSPDYMPGPEHPPSPDYVSGPKEDLEEDPTDYPADGGDDDDDDESSDDDYDDDDDDDVEEDEDEEHLAPALYLLHRTARMSVRPQILMSDTVEALITEYASAPTPPSPSPPQSLLSPLSSPLPQIPSPPLPLLSPPTTSPTYIEAPLGYRAARIRLRVASPSTYHLSEIPSPPLLLPYTTHKDDLPEADMPLQKRAHFTTPTGRFEVGESSSAATARQARHTLAHSVDYGFVDTVDTSKRASESKAMTTIGEVNDRVTDLATTQRQDTQEIYVRCKDAQDDQALLGAQAWSHSESRIQAMEAQIRVLQRDVDVQQRQRIRDEDRLTAHIQHKHDKTSRNGYDNQDSGTGSRSTKRAARECNYSNFLKCQPLNFKGTEGVVGPTQWFERMELVFHISNCAVGNQIKFATCTLLGSALTWWNSHVKVVGHNAAYGMTWKSLMKMMTDKYCPRGEIKKLEIEIWNLKVKGTDVASYTQHFQELALMCGRMFPEESDQVEKYVGGLPDMIQGSVMASKPKTMQEAIEIANDLMDQKIRTLAERQAENKRKFEDTSRNNQNQQQPFKRHNVARAYTAGPREKKPAPPSAPTARGLTISPGTGHFKNNCSKLRNKNQGNQARNGNVVARAYDVGTAGTNPKSNVVTGTFLLNNRYVSILFDTGADRSFVSTTFSSLIDTIPTTLDHGYDVKLADGRIIWVNTLIRGCTLNFSNHPFNIDLVPVEMGSFEVIIGMD
ncbi:putative reverse transcriptase domain-containing protein [Tanacetum coccineum]